MGRSLLRSISSYAIAICLLSKTVTSWIDRSSEYPSIGPELVIWQLSGRRESLKPHRSWLRYSRRHPAVGPLIQSGVHQGDLLFC